MVRKNLEVTTSWADRQQTNISYTQIMLECVTDFKWMIGRCLHKRGKHYEWITYIRVWLRYFAQIVTKSCFWSKHHGRVDKWMIRTKIWIKYCGQVIANYCSWYIVSTHARRKYYNKDWIQICSHLVKIGSELIAWSTNTQQINTSYI